MKRYWAAAPTAVHRAVVAGIMALAVVIPLQMLVLYRLTTRLSAQLTSFDPFAVLDGTAPAQPTPAWEAFIAGFSASGAATLGTLALMASIRLAAPYRNRSLRTAQIAGIGHLLLVTATIAGALIGNRSWDARTIGTFASIVWLVPVLVLTFHPLVRAWSVPLLPPPPDLSSRS
jgi:hypothetical protein